VDFEDELLAISANTEQTYEIFTWATKYDPKTWLDAL
jgi:hypothetical protein